MKCAKYILISLALCGCSGDEPDREPEHIYEALEFEYSYAASYSPDKDVEIMGVLIERPQFGFDYERVVIMRLRGRTHRCELGGDTGGYPGMCLYRQGNDYIVVANKCKWFKVDMRTGKMTEEQRDYEKVSPKEYLGEFNFLQDKWQFISAKQGQYEHPFVYKGG